RLVIEHVTSRWGVLILIELLDRPHRFSELRRAVSGYGRAVSEKMLTQTLRALERDGLLTRTVTPTVPVTVTYELTDLGLSLHHMTRGLREWAQSNMDHVLANREKHDARA
ncbi:helix-turn-helix transcriptional regulator, partial [Xylella fastidiosa subsp. multiplex]|nr:helix-turn-helix transcriptional regulator [Xylella fastidiosa subsp. multiplex]